MVVGGIYIVAAIAEHWYSGKVRIVKESIGVRFHG